MTPTRSDIDQHVERAYDLFRDYRQALVTDASGDPQAQLPGLEQVLRQWLPEARAANDALIEEVHTHLGERAEALRLLVDADLAARSAENVRRVVETAVADSIQAHGAVATCRVEIENWQGLLPPVRRDFRGQRVIEPWDRKPSCNTGMFWTGDLTERPSFRGASWSLAVALDSVVAEALRKQLPRDAYLPAILLAVALREVPDWCSADAWDLLRLVDDRVELAAKVKNLLAELEVLAPPVRDDRQESPVGVEAPDRGEADDVRISFDEATEGLLEAGLDPVPDRTLRRWLSEPTSADILGVDPGPTPAPRYKRPLLAGLKLLQKAGKPRSPKHRGAGGAGKEGAAEA